MALLPIRFYNGDDDDNDDNDDDDGTETTTTKTTTTTTKTATTTTTTTTIVRIVGFFAVDVDVDLVFFGGHNSTAKVSRLSGSAVDGRWSRTVDVHVDGDVCFFEAVAVKRPKFQNCQGRPSTTDG